MPVATQPRCKSTLDIFSFQDRRWEKKFVEILWKLKKRKRRLVKISEIFEKKKERSIHRKNCKSKKIILKENQNEDDLLLRQFLKIKMSLKSSFKLFNGVIGQFLTKNLIDLYSLKNSIVISSMNFEIYVLDQLGCNSS